ncbi:hypothetical protein MPER_15436, partial [Moniliophthora perniciosa FA553]
TFSASRYWGSEQRLNSLDILTEEEEMIRETVQRFANDVVKAKVREMDENEMMDPEIIKGLFEQGSPLVDGYRNPECTRRFTIFIHFCHIYTIEELAKVDPS